MNSAERTGKGAAKYGVAMSGKIAKVSEDVRDIARMRAEGYPDEKIKKFFGLTDKKFEKILMSPEFEWLFNRYALVKAHGYLIPTIEQLGQDAQVPGATRSQEAILKITGVWKDKRDIKIEQKTEQMILHGSLADLAQMHPHDACREMLRNIKTELGIDKDVLLEYVNEVYLEEDIENE